MNGEPPPGDPASGETLSGETRSGETRSGDTSSAGQSNSQPSGQRTVPRCLPTYRETELALIADCVRRGQSLALVGVAGSGKTNIVNILREDAACRRRYLGDEVETAHFPVVNVYTWRTGQPAQLWQMMNAALERTTEHLPPTPFRVIQSIAEEERVFRRLQDRVDLVCQQHGRRVMFVLDDGDVIFSTAPRAVIDQLYALRTAGNRERLTYLVITKRLPHLLGRAHHIAESKFYHLFQNHVYALGLYTWPDARQMVRHLDHLAGGRLPPDDQARIVYYGGRHSGLIRAVFDTWLDTEPDRANPEGWLVQQPAVRTALRRILAGLHPEEQEAALHLAHGALRPDEALVADHLRVRGLLERVDPPQWFSGIMALYLASLPLTERGPGPDSQATE